MVLNAARGKAIRLTVAAPARSGVVIVQAAVPRVRATALRSAPQVGVVANSAERTVIVVPVAARQSGKAA